MNQTFEPVYDIQREGFPYWWAGGVALVVAVGGIVASIVRLRAFRRGTSPRQLDFVLGGGITLVVIGHAFLFVVTFVSHLAILHAVAAGRAEYVEGPVVGFVPMPYEGHADEQMVVNGKSFSYSDFDLRPGFNRSRSHGGPIHEGAEVRVWYVGRSIVRLEIAK